MCWVGWGSSDIPARSANSRYTDGHCKGPHRHLDPPFHTRTNRPTELASAPKPTKETTLRILAKKTSFSSSFSSDNQHQELVARPPSPLAWADASFPLASLTQSGEPPPSHLRSRPANLSLNSLPGTEAKDVCVLVCNSFILRTSLIRSLCTLSLEMK